VQHQFSLDPIARRLTVLCMFPLLPIAIIELGIWETSPFKIYGLNQPKVTILLLFTMVFAVAFSPEKFFRYVPKLDKRLGLVVLGIFLFLMDKKLVLHSHADKFALYQNPLIPIIALLLTVQLVRFKYAKSSKIISLITLVSGIVWAGHLASYLLIDERHPYLYNWVNLQLVIHPIIQTDFGKTTFIDMHSQYGGYALILEPLFKLIGVNLFKISFVFAMIFFISLLSIFLVLFKLCKNPLFAIIGFLSTTFLMMYAFFMWPFEKYYQVYPIRIFFPIISTVLILYASKMKEKTFLLLAVTLNMLAIYWNPETGITMTVALLLFACIKWGQSNWRHIMRIGITFLTELSVLFVGFKVIQDLTNDGTFSFEMMFRSMFFYLSGIEINSLKIWFLVFFLYGLTFIHSGYEFRRDKFQNRSELDILLYVGLLGMGLLTYHLNYMNEASLACVIWPFGVLLTVLIDFYFQESKHIPRFVRGKKNAQIGLEAKKLFLDTIRKFEVKHLALFTLTYLAVCSIMIQFSQSVKDEERIWDLSKPNSQRQLYNDIDAKGNSIFVTVADQIAGRVSTPGARINFVKSIATAETQEDMLILSQWDSILYLHANAKAPISWPNWYIAYFDYEFEEVYKRLLDGSIKKVVVDEIPGALGQPFKLHAPGLDEKIFEIIESRFTLVRKVELPMAYTGYVTGNWAKTYISVYELR